MNSRQSQNLARIEKKWKGWIGYLPRNSQDFAHIVDCPVCNQDKPIDQYTRRDIKHMKHHVDNPNGVNIDSRTRRMLERVIEGLPVGNGRVTFDS